MYLVFKFNKKQLNKVIKKYGDNFINNFFNSLMDLVILLNKKKITNRIRSKYINEFIVNSNANKNIVKSFITVLENTLKRIDYKDTIIVFDKRIKDFIIYKLEEDKPPWIE